jgi:WD40 repeat protein
VRLWRRGDFKLRRVLRGLKLMVRAVSFSPDGKLVAVAGSRPDASGTIPTDAGEARLWSVAAGRPRLTIHDPAGEIKSIAFSPNNVRFAGCGARDGQIRIWNVHTGARVGLIGRRTDHLYSGSVAFAPDGRTIVSGGTAIERGEITGLVALWDVRSGALIHKDTDGDWVEVIALSEDGATVAAGGTNHGTITLRDAASGAIRRVLHGNVVRARSAAFVPDGSTIAAAVTSGETGRAICFWKARSAALQRSIRWSASGSGGEYYHELVLSRDGRILLGGGGHQARIWDMKSGRHLTTPVHPVLILLSPGWKCKHVASTICPPGVRFAISRRLRWRANSGSPAPLSTPGQLRKPTCWRRHDGLSIEKCG